MRGRRVTIGWPGAGAFRRIAAIADRGLGRLKWADSEPFLTAVVRPLSRPFKPFPQHPLIYRLD